MRAKGALSRAASIYATQLEGSAQAIEQRDAAPSLVDQLVDRLAEWVAALIAARARFTDNMDVAWFDSRRAAEYLGVHRDTLRKLEAERARACTQEVAGSWAVSHSIAAEYVGIEVESVRPDDHSQLGVDADLPEVGRVAEGSPIGPQSPSARSPTRSLPSSKIRRSAYPANGSTAVTVTKL